MTTETPLMKQDAAFPAARLSLVHLALIVLSNFAVQIPLSLFGIDTTWGMFTYPFIYVTTDLTVRLFGSVRARSIVRNAALPGFFLSYLVGVLFEQGAFRGFESLFSLNVFVLRIAAASLLAYCVSQMLDICVFRRLMRRAWWIGPAASGVIGNIIDTYLFYSVAFYQTTDAWMAAHWFEIASVDLTLKLIVNLLVFVPIYGTILNLILRKFAQSRPS